LIWTGGYKNLIRSDFECCRKVSAQFAVDPCQKGDSEDSGEPADPSNGRGQRQGSPGNPRRLREINNQQRHTAESGQCTQGEI